MKQLETVIYFKKAPSSQNIIKENIPVYLNQIVHVDHQLNGYGTFKKPWVSNSQDLTFSYLIKKEINHKEMLLKESLILYDTLNPFHSEIYIKPPNDIYTKKGKLAGILIEEIHHDNHVYWAIGIGINRSKKSFDTFKSDALDPNSSKEDVLKAFIKTHNAFKSNHITKRYLEIVSKTPLVATYKTVSSKVTEIDQNLKVHTELFEAPLEWVTLNPLFK
jgi:BirA family biotin operon repressor/biotin-[acetyl-CoA-carboxylase] ligase